MVRLLFRPTLQLKGPEFTIGMTSSLQPGGFKKKHRQGFKVCAVIRLDFYKKDPFIVRCRPSVAGRYVHWFVSGHAKHDVTMCEIQIYGKPMGTFLITVFHVKHIVSGIVNLETLSASLTLCEGIHRLSVDTPGPVTPVFMHKQTIEETVEWPVIWDAITLMWRQCNVIMLLS